MKQKRTHGNRQAQLARRRERMKNRPAPGDHEILIDGNVSRYSVAYCTWHAGFLTIGLMETHECKISGCPYLEELGEE